MKISSKKLFPAICCTAAVLFSLPLSLQAQYSEKDIYAYIEKYQAVAIQKMCEHKIPASITIAQGIFESGCGKSHLAVDGNNHFGIKCHQDWTGDTILIDDDELQECFRKYESVAESFDDHSLFLKNRKRYANLFQLDIMDYASWARTLKADGYATNPKYAEQLISIIERFGIARLDTMGQDLLQKGSFADVQAEALAGAPVWKMSVKADDTKKQDLKHKPVDKTVVQQEERKPVVQTSQPAYVGVKVFTAIGSDYPAGNSPFSFRKVFENNHTYFVIAQKNDTYEAIAEDVQVDAASLRKFNDVLGNSQPVENEIVYVEAKSKSHVDRIHRVQAGETLRYIAQRYGVQLNYLFKYNNLSENSIIHPGDQILLKH